MNPVTNKKRGQRASGSEGPPADDPPSYATTAYRRDLQNAEGGFGDRDSIWLAVASMLEHASLFSDRERRSKLRSALQVAKTAADPAGWRRLRAREWQRAGLGPTDAVVAIADEAHDAGAFHLAGHILDAVLAVAGSLTPLQRGRIVDRRARVHTKLGQLDAAADRYEAVLRLGVKARVPELQARGYLGRTGLAQMRGNYPDVIRFATRAAAIADRHRLRASLRHAHSGLMIAAAVNGRFDDALAHGWIVYRVARGDPVEEAEILQNLAQALFDAGHFREASAGFAAVACRPLPARLILPALGGLALAAAKLQDTRTVRWASREIERLVRSAAPRYSVASALLESAQALAAINEPAAAGRRAHAAAALANTHGFHEIAYKADSLELSSDAPEQIIPEALGPAAAAVARDVARLAPKRLPSRLAPVPG